MERFLLRLNMKFVASTTEDPEQRKNISYRSKLATFSNKSYASRTILFLSSANLNTLLEVRRNQKHKSTPSNNNIYKNWKNQNFLIAAS